MPRSLTFAVLVLVFIGSFGLANAANRVFYAGGNAKEKFNDVHYLSDGSALIAGQSEDLNWLAPNVPRISLGVNGIDSAAAGQIGFLLHTSADFSQVLRVLSFPAGSVRDIFKIRSTEVPGAATGEIFISGSRDGSATNGYYLAKLNGNFVSAIPSATSYTFNVDASGDHKERQPWDVGGDGKVVFAIGQGFAADWAAIQKLGTAGSREVVENWHAHWRSSGAEWDGTPASSDVGTPALSYSAIVMKVNRRGSLRSSNAADFAFTANDANGNPGRQGKYPDDYYHNAFCALSGTNTCPNAGPGYTGYRAASAQTQRVGAIAIDRRNNNLYFGYSTKSILPDNNPDFEPAVVAMRPDGSVLWWDRLYQETTANSTPDQYVDGLAIDYLNARLVVMARTHGNNTINLWRGNSIAGAASASGFQNQFTGTNGNIHISWLGSYGLADGRIRAASYVAEYVESASNTFGAALTDPHYAGWPNPNGGWPNVNTTRCGADAGYSGEIAIDTSGNVAIVCKGRRTFTTLDAFQSMPRPNQTPMPTGSWNEFVRVYSADLRDVKYSSLLVGAWDQSTGVGGDNIRLAGLALRDGHVSAVGWHTADSVTGVAAGATLPTIAVPSWGSGAPSSQSAVAARLSGTRLVSAPLDQLFASGFE